MYVRGVLMIQYTVKIIYILTRQFVFHLIDQALDPAFQHRVQGRKSDYRHLQHYTNDSLMYHSHM